MLSKLMKYDFREQGRMLWPVQFAVIVGGILAGLCLTFTLTGMMAMPEESDPTVVQTVLIIMITLIMMYIMTSSVVTQVLVARQYYQNCFCDEGYLTFTLPVKTTNILVSKVLTGGAWTMINALCVFGGLALFLWIGFGATEYPQEVMEGIQELKAEFLKLNVNVNWFWLGVKYFVLMIISSVASVSMLQFVVTVGNQIAKKHKVLCAVAIYLLLTFVISIASSVLSNMLMLPLYSQPDPSFSQFVNVFDRAMMGSFLISIVSMGAMFFFTDRMVKNKLNLE